MAYTDVQSNEIPEDTQYYSGKLPLGDYTFYMQIDNSSGAPKVVTRCDSPDGIRAATQRTLPEGSNVTQWTVDANDTTADVYAIVSSGVSLPVSPNGANSGSISSYRGTGHFSMSSGNLTFIPSSSTSYLGVYASKDPDAFVSYTAADGEISTYALSSSYSIGGNTVYYYYADGGPWDMGSASPASSSELYGQSPAQIAWALIYGNSKGSEGVLVARFAIDLGDAGGYPGGGGDWTQPGDWNPDPTTTLHLTINGALSGRHNDPLTDLSYSYVPADNTAQADYGCGGDGGHGGGGGAGASTIIVRQFATNKANSKDIVALAKRHGYGSGGGKGGKGGAGCILIYY